MTQQEAEQLRPGNIISIGTRLAIVGPCWDDDIYTCYDLDGTQDTIERIERMKFAELTSELMDHFDFKNNDYSSIYYKEVGKNFYICWDVLGISLIHEGEFDEDAIELKNNHAHRLQNLHQSLTGDKLVYKK